MKPVDLLGVVLMLHNTEGNSSTQQPGVRCKGTKSRVFQEGDLVLRLIQDQTDAHKLSPPWEGPFVVSKNLHNGSYYHIDVRERKDSSKSEEETRRPWNIAQLRPYYT